MMLGIIGLLLPGLVWGVNTERFAQQIPVTIRLAHPDGAVDLRGIAIYKRAIQPIYAAAFYTQNTVLTPAQALSDPGYKRMLFFFLSPVTDFDKLIREGMQINNAPGVMQEEQIHVTRFLKMINRPFKAGDIIMFDYLPQKGMRIIINTTVEGIIPSQDFYNYVLKIWMGREPPSLKFRHDLFVRPENTDLNT